MKRLAQRRQGVASDYITHLDALESIPDQLVLYLRVSTKAQDYKGHLTNHLIRFIQELRNQGYRLTHEIVAIYDEVTKADTWDRLELRRAARYAQEHACPLVTLTTCRFIRSRHSSPQNWDVLPSVEEFEELEKLTLGVQLATLYDPDLLPTESMKVLQRIGYEQRQWAPSELSQRELLNAVIAELNGITPTG